MAVIGLGGVGLSCVMGAALAGASRIVAVDRVPAKLATAIAMGATDGLLAADDASETLAAVRDLTEGGPDYAFEAIGRPTTVELAIAVLPVGGTAVLVGMTPLADRASFEVYPFVDGSRRCPGLQLWLRGSGGRLPPVCRVAPGRPAADRAAGAASRRAFSRSAAVFARVPSATALSMVAAAAFRAAAAISTSVTPRFAAKVARNVAHASPEQHGESDAALAVAAAATGSNLTGAVGAGAAATAPISAPPTSALMTMAPARPMILRFGIDLDPHSTTRLTWSRHVHRFGTTREERVCATFGVFTTP